ncbi:putative metal-dependent hydrolase [Staphylococcus sp. 30400_3112M30941]|nr:putative metal-dependent hydrolase [Staphylococcus sp. 30403_3112M30944]MBO0945200.1 putative metal-dependent hydrolase [Staphylococcus sp. 30402_3112M30943]MBO0964922.1 putative metal-dependent hydrolase [Staphylococcus sp. 30400_3112M30941]MBO0965668.1 putative metal-dependent hydrolase [Staphylococcus sp. 30401_3112M30942]
MNVRFPIGQLKVPETITSAHIEGWTNEINEYSSKLGSIVNHLDEEELNRTYRQGAWTVRQLVHHIVDSQLNLYLRLKLALTDNEPYVSEFNQEQWALQSDYDLPVQVSVDLLRNLNIRVVALIKKISTTQLSRAFELQNTGSVTVGETIAKLSWHERHHLAHIQIALSQFNEEC